MKATTSLINDGMEGTPSKSSKEEARKYGSHREAIGNKYAAIREQSKQASSNMKPVEKNIASAKVSLLDTSKPNPGNTTEVPSSGLASKWASMKSGFQSFKANVGAKKFLPLRQIQESDFVSRVSSSESLDDIFQRLKRPSVDHVSYADNDDDGEDDMEIKNSGHR